MSRRRPPTYGRSDVRSGRRPLRTDVNLALYDSVAAAAAAADNDVIRLVQITEPLPGFVIVFHDIVAFALTVGSHILLFFKEQENLQG